MNEDPLIKRLDELERTYAPEQLPADAPEQARVRAEEGSDAVDTSTSTEPPEPGPVANIGTAPSAAAVPLKREDEEDRER
jgi:hypothetical protein